MKGLVQVYTGDSKGKTTAALGLIIRAIGHGYRAAIVQYMKGSSYYGELATLTRLKPQVDHWQYGRICSHNSLIQQGESDCLACGKCFVIKGNESDFDLEYSRLSYKRGLEVVSSGQYNVVVLDEILNALYFELISEEDILKLIAGRPQHVELVLTGRNATPAIIEQAQLVTEMKKIKHPFDIGVNARRGIEY